MKQFENELIEKGYKNIAGIDEVGRGCWAGPLVVAIVILDNDYINNEIKDSKKLSQQKRLELFNCILKEAKLVDWIILDAKYVDQYNPKKTTIFGMEKLIIKHKNIIDYCLIDAEKVNVNIQTKSIIKGDSLSISIAAASIVAKVIRDRIMIDLDKKYPKYNFSKHKGYGTKMHLEALKKYGPIKNIHRFSYKPIKLFTK